MKVQFSLLYLAFFLWGCTPSYPNDDPLATFKTHLPTEWIRDTGLSTDSLGNPDFFTYRGRPSDFHRTKSRTIAITL